MLLVGCCGKAGLKLEDYAKKLNLLEVQETFYRIIARESTLLGWRQKVGDKFVFTVKAFQGLTHTHTSPTWRRAGRIPFHAEPGNFGHLQDTEEVKKSWEYTLWEARTLKAKFVVLQFPASFKPSDENLERIRRFFRKREIAVGIEVRGDKWREENWQEKLRETLGEVGVTHVVDPLAWRPLHVEGIAYFRLHGKLPGYDYQYTTGELKRIISEASKHPEAYVLFNNLAMLEDALRLKALIEGREIRLPDLEERMLAISGRVRYPVTLAEIIRKYGYLRVRTDSGEEATLREALKGYKDLKAKAYGPEDLTRIARKAL